MATKPAKAKNQQFYILNVKLRHKLTKEDLDVEAYERLFRKLWRKKIHKKSSSLKHCIIKSYYEEKNNKGKIEYFAGLLAQFTYIGNESWFNITKLDVEEDFHLPDDIFPDLLLTDYIFIPAAHRFCYLKDYKAPLNPYSVRNFLEKALDDVLEKNEIVQVDVETAHDAIQKILNAKEVHSLNLNVNYSNFDTSEDTKKFFEDNLRNSNTGSMEITAKAKKGSSIDISKSKILEGGLEVARSNGEAEAKITDKSGNKLTVKTVDYPRIENVFGITTRFSRLVYENVLQIFRRK